MKDKMAYTQPPSVENLWEAIEEVWALKSPGVVRSSGIQHAASHPSSHEKHEDLLNIET